mmetsp:Transcript_25020/g.45066  ORF Transcript_25020/g.45066 Transcript_25020/m.45066 type:complete len:285 (-) Transcript_25020:50-904(-)
MIYNHTDILDHLDAMIFQEDTTRCFNYFKMDTSCRNVNEACRKAMVTWMTHVQNTLSLSPETIWIAMSFFDRYLSSGRGNAEEVLKSKCMFQLAAITAFYTAVKIYEPVVLGIDMLIQICRGMYTKSDIVEMEKNILSALDWRVSSHTPMDFARYLLELLPGQAPSYDSDGLLEMCQKQVDLAVTDIYFSCCTPSVVGISCLASSLTQSYSLSLSEKQALWVTLSRLCHFDLSPKEVIAARQRLLSYVSPYKPNSVSKLATLSQSNTSVSSSSPICVMQTARQA